MPTALPSMPVCAAKGGEAEIVTSRSVRMGATTRECAFSLTPVSVMRDGEEALASSGQPLRH